MDLPITMYMALVREHYKLHVSGAYTPYDMGFPWLASETHLQSLIYFHETAVLKIILEWKQILQALKNIFSTPGQVECAQLYQGMAAEVLHPWRHTQCKIMHRYWFRTAVTRTARKMHKCYCHYLWQRCKHDKSRVALLWNPVSGCP